MNQPAAPVVFLGSDPRSITGAAKLLRGGAVLAIPTDTVYGLSASVFRPEAMRRVLRVKERSHTQGLPVLLATAADLPILTGDVSRAAWKLIAAFWPGALTLVFPAKRGTPVELTGGGTTVAARVPAGRTILSLLQSLGEPVVGTSANIHGQMPAVTAAQVLERMPDRIDGILVDDELPGSGEASTVVEIVSDRCFVHRRGAIPAEALRQALGSMALVLPGEQR
ncbi:MAG: L-threonylcarbamoyladenylate synthase [Chloroflexota bacterium]